MKKVFIRDLGTQSVFEKEFPLKIGADLASDIRVNAPLSTGMILLLDQLDGKIFLQKINKNEKVFFNDESLTDNQVVQNRDRVSLRDKTINFSIDENNVELLVTTKEDFQSTQFELNKKQSIFRNKLLRRFSVVFSMVLFYFLAYLFSANAVRIEVIPNNAQVSIQGGLFPHFKIGERFLITNGEYNITVVASGYFPKKEMVVIDEEHLEYNIELIKLPGKLFIETFPDTVFNLLSNNQIIKQSDEGYYLVNAGPSNIKIQSERYFPIESVVSIAGMNKEQFLEFTLKPAWADINISSSPTSAKVFIDGNFTGETPNIFEVVEGNRLLSIEKDGYKAFTRELNIKANRKIDLGKINLLRLDSKIRILTKPDKASVNIDSTYQGLSPLELDLQPLVEHSLVISKPGYKSLSDTFKLPIVEELKLQNKKGYIELEKSLEPLYGQISILGNEGTKIILNNQIQGLVPMNMDLLAIDQKLIFEKEGYVSQTKLIKPTPGLKQTININMLTPEQDVLARLPRIIQTSQGLKMILIKPGALTVGSPRKSQGRRSNETERLVEITKPFYVGIREVINNEFRAFKPDHKSGAEVFKELSNGLHPTVMVSWEDTVAFCNWLSQKESLQPAYELKDDKYELIQPITNGYRLLSEAEWEWIARYNGGAGDQKFPWGQRMPPEEESGNFAGELTESIVKNYMSDYFDGYPVTSPPKKFKPNLLGIYDLGGNVAEWVNDYYSVFPKNTTSAIQDPFGPFIGNTKVIKGSSWRDSSVTALRYSYRDYGSLPRLDVGFRIARYNTVDIDN